MEVSVEYNEHVHNHVIDVTIGDSTSTFTSQEQHNAPYEMHNEDRYLMRNLATASRISSFATGFSRNASLRRRGERRGLGRRNFMDSGLWNSVILLGNLTQIVAAVVVLSLSKHEHPRTPLFTWVIGYTVGCVANLPRLYWRYIHPNNQASDQESAPTHQLFPRDNSAETISYTNVSFPQDMDGSVRLDTIAVSRLSQNVVVVNSRRGALIAHFKMALECFFVVWFVIGNVWVFGGRSAVADAPNLYRLCVALLTFSCIGYAMPFILCVTICCCFPCIISVLGLREDLHLNRGATSEVINALPTYKFKSRSTQNRHSRQISLENFDGVAVGMNKDRIVSPEDASCCICLAAYIENDMLRELPCAHFFHAECVDKWLKISALCPLCKYIVVASTGLSSVLSSIFSNNNQY